jgi:hypothetical protein
MKVPHALRRIGSVNLKAPRASASVSGNMNVGRLAPSINVARNTA